jgi:hypothetical protein
MGSMIRRRTLRLGLESLPARRSCKNIGRGATWGTLLCPSTPTEAWPVARICHINPRPWRERWLRKRRHCSRSWRSGRRIKRNSRPSKLCTPQPPNHPQLRGTRTHPSNPPRIHPLSRLNFFLLPSLLRPQTRLKCIISIRLYTMCPSMLSTNSKFKAKEETTRETREVRNPSNHHNCPRCRSSSPCSLTTPGRRRSELIYRCATGVCVSLRGFFYPPLSH